jgi:hypothetical protein
MSTDPHKRALTATVLDCRGRVLGTEVFWVSGDGHRAMEAWATSFGHIERWGVEGGSKEPVASAGTRPCTWPEPAMT